MIEYYCSQAPSRLPTLWRTELASGTLQMRCGCTHLLPHTVKPWQSSTRGCLPVVSRYSSSRNGNDWLYYTLVSLVIIFLDASDSTVDGLPVTAWAPFRPHWYKHGQNVGIPNTFDSETQTPHMLKDTFVG